VASPPGAPTGSAAGPPVGHDAEFRALFVEEARGRLETLAETLLALEEQGGGAEHLAILLRELHTLKGASGMLGLPHVTSLIHAFEDLLGPHRDGSRARPPRLVDASLAAVDGLRDVIESVGRGEDHAAAAANVEMALRRSIAAEDGVAVLAVTREAAVPLPITPPCANPPPRDESAVVPVADHAPATRSEASTITLPVARLDELVRLVGESTSALMRTGHVLGDALGRDPSSVTEFRDLSRTLAELQELTIRTRMVPVATIGHQLQRAVRELSRSLGKEVRWEMVGGDTELDRRVLDHLADPLLHLVRNAVDHGLEPPDERLAAGKHRQGVVRLHAMQLGPEVIIAVSDDGRGIDLARVRDAARRQAPEVVEQGDDELLYSIFRPGLTTARQLTDVSGRGVGLDVVNESLHSVRGRIEVRNHPGEGCEFLIAVPITLAVLPCLIVVSAGRRYAVPRHAVLTAVALDEENTLHAGGHMVRVGSQAVPLSSLAGTLGAGAEESGHSAIVLSGLARSHAFRVDSLAGQRDVVIKGLGELLPRLDVVAGAGIEADGSVLLVLDPAGLMESARRAQIPAANVPDAGGRTIPEEEIAAPRSVLVVDDALAVRELQRAILQRAGYQVRTASDGVEALALLAEQPSDLVITDVEMPRLDGFALTEAIRAQPGVRHAAVLILTSRGSDEDRRRGLEAGADGYIVKSSFDQAALLDAVERLLGRPR
jgi:two-component system chemotaxis sensor kinase CheA